jgi:hypothetical protein
MIREPAYSAYRIDYSGEEYILFARVASGDWQELKRGDNKGSLEMELRRLADAARQQQPSYYDEFGVEIVR